MKWIKYFLLLVFLSLVVIIYLQFPRLNIISGYGAKNMCSCLFEASRTQEFVKETDNNFSPIDIAIYEVDTVQKRVTSSVMGMMKRTAVYHEDLGCQLIQRGAIEPKINYAPVPHNCPLEAPYPYGNEEQKDTLLSSINYANLQQIIDDSFDKEGVDKLQTRSLLVLYKDQIIAEKYDEGFTKKSAILGWSMTKSVLATLFGVLEKEGRIDIDATHLFPEWENDDRKNISLNALLQMSSGLEWEEDYNKICDVTQMLFLDTDMTKKQLNKPLAFDVNSHWSYASGTTNLLSGYLRKQFSTHEEYLNFPVQKLFDELGASSFMIETDLSGNYIGSSYGWATTRDWGKLGLLYLHRGNWNGYQILNESWVDYISTACEDSKGAYGAHFWLNAGSYLPDVPKDMYYMDGYQGQRVFIIPSKDLVVVRMGLANMDFNNLLKEIIKSIK